MFAALQNLHQIVNFLSVRTKNLNVEDKDGTTILMHHVLQGNYKMSSRLIYRGAKIDMVNKFGKTALHLCVEKKLNEAVDYLLYKGANPHILDLTEQDCCDKAKQNGLASQILRFNNCTLRKKVIPLMPNGKYPEMQYQKYYKKQEFGKKMWKSLAKL